MDPDKVEQAVPFLNSDEESASDFSHRERHSHRPKWTWSSITVIVLGFVLCNAATLAISRWFWRSQLDQTCSRHTSQSWSPMMDGVDIKYETVRFDGTFFGDNIYREAASPEVDEAWRGLGIEYNGIIVSKEDASRAGILPDRIQLNETYGGPGYPALFEVFHQLHCLDLVRKALYFNVDYYLELGQGPFAHKGRQLRPHVGHCLDTIRQQLMCTADTGLVPFLWAGDPPDIFPDFYRQHTCKNFEEIRAWAEANQGDFEDAPVDKPQEDELILPKIP